MKGSRPLGLLFLTIFIAMLGLSVLFPVLAPLSKELGITTAQTTWLSTVYSLAQFLSAPWWGHLSETRGRRPILILGLIGFAISFGLFGYMAHLGMEGVLTGTPLLVALLAARVAGGLLSSATLPTAQAYIADITPPEKRAGAMGLIGAAFGLGIIFGPAIGGILSQGGNLLIPIFFSSGLALITALTALAILPESIHLRPKTQDNKAKVSFLRGEIPVLLVVSMLTTLASVGMEQTISFYIQDNLKISGPEAVKTISIALFIFGMVAVAVQGGLIRVLAKKMPQSTLIWIGLAVMGAGMLLMPYMHTFWSITFALCMIGFGSAFIGPSISAALSLQVAANQQGSIAGVNSSATALGRMTGPIIAGYLYQYVSPGSPYLFSGIVLMVLLVVSLGSLKTQKPAVTAH
ncbi:MFS transporter [Deinococcus cellulosilyticus]|uniref:MFS transporter n=1 Tax=Deinococcus cellulosilyticus (strain DSM 18568 / NBRC 106333 / KACC 11606 / 5516J-15) TaxID=1223518 RepID=A0A511N2Q7_DEIC1|nr:MFS transporter [Deinococcus cellulosilyticus]GEM47139.1 MFS transporter [Deinococcus cellulosilyticus NBRC 106333 = KACC 11606]